LTAKWRERLLVHYLWERAMPAKKITGMARSHNESLSGRSCLAAISAMSLGKIVNRPQDACFSTSCPLSAIRTVGRISRRRNAPNDDRHITKTKKPNTRREVERLVLHSMLPLAVNGGLRSLASPPDYAFG
jgi:hypothetical protein